MNGMSLAQAVARASVDEHAVLEVRRSHADDADARVLSFSRLRAVKKPARSSAFLALDVGDGLFSLDQQLVSLLELRDARLQRANLCEAAKKLPTGGTLARTFLHARAPSSPPAADRGERTPTLWRAEIDRDHHDRGREQDGDSNYATCALEHADHRTGLGYLALKTLLPSGGLARRRPAPTGQRAPSHDRCPLPRRRILSVDATKR